ncbi:hypothetical protein [Clostridium sp.]|jgi:hypothetical protein|uniref:hypothetical protein n=1 Tax=Clostridium sp. TaxID=1506 RepID=UPI002FDCE385
MYDKDLNYKFHKKVIEELVRITSKEIRVFPIVNLKCEKSLFVDKLIEDGCFSKYEIKTVKVNYEFVKGGNEMLVIRVQ